MGVMKGIKSLLMRRAGKFKPSHTEKSFKEMLANHREHKEKLVSTDIKYRSPEHKEALRRYTFNDHGPINALMRRDKKHPYYPSDSFVKDKSKSHIKNLKQTAKDHTLERDTVVYRGISDEEAHSLHNKKRNHVRNFLSTSTSHKFAKEWHDEKGGHVIKIKVPKGTPHIHSAKTSGYDNEKEVILPPGTLHVHKKVTRPHPDHGFPIHTFHAHYTPHHIKESLEESEEWRKMRAAHKKYKTRLMSSTPKPADPEKRSVLKSYVGSGYHKINDHMWGTRQFRTSEVEGHVKRKVGHLKSLLRGHKSKSPMVVFRAVDAHHAPETGKTFHNKGFMSTTTDVTAAHSFKWHGEDGYKHIMRIKVPKKSPALHPGKHSEYDNEKEVILHPGHLHVHKKTTVHVPPDGTGSKLRGYVYHHAHYEPEKKKRLNEGFFSFFKKKKKTEPKPVHTPAAIATHPKKLEEPKKPEKKVSGHSEPTTPWGKFRKEHRDHKNHLTTSNPTLKNDEEKKSLQSYTDGGYQTINPTMRGDVHHPNSAHKAHHLKQVLFRHQTKKPMVVYRGINPHKEKYKEGSHVSTKHFLSTTTSHKVAKDWDGMDDDGFDDDDDDRDHNHDHDRHTHVMRIKVHPGSHAVHPGHHSDHAHEKEVILAPGHLHVHKIVSQRYGHSSVRMYHAHYHPHKESVHESAAWREFRKGHKEHKKALITSEPHVKTPEEHDAIQNYVGAGYASINKAMRVGPHQNQPHWGKHGHHMKQALFRHRTEKPLIVHRGIVPENEKYKEGDVVSTKHFLSTTTSHRFAKSWADGPQGSKHIMRIRVHPGSHAMHPGSITSHPHEKEVILGPGTLHIHKIVSQKYKEQKNPS